VIMWETSLSMIKVSHW